MVVELYEKKVYGEEFVSGKLIRETGMSMMQKGESKEFTLSRRLRDVNCL